MLVTFRIGLGATIVFCWDVYLRRIAVCDGDAMMHIFAPKTYYIC